MNDLLGNLLPSFAIVEDAGHHDSKRAETVTATRPLEPIATTEDAGIILFRWFCLQQLFNLQFNGESISRRRGDAEVRWIF